MGYPITMLPYVVDKARNNGCVPPSLLRPKYLPFDNGATEQWVFANGLVGLTGQKNGGMCTPNSALPTFNTGSLTLSPGNHCGLITSENEALIETVCCVMLVDTSAGNKMLLGNLLYGGSNGWGFFVQSGVYKINTPGISGDPHTITLPSGATSGVWMFVGIAHTATARYVFIGNSGVGGNVWDTYTGTHNLSSPVRPHCIGEVDYTTGWNGAESFAHFEHFAGEALTLAQFEADYANVQAALANNGVTVL